jgi:hypothetical protein
MKRIFIRDEIMNHLSKSWTVIDDESFQDCHQLNCRLMMQSKSLILMELNKILMNISTSSGWSAVLKRKRTNHSGFSDIFAKLLGQDCLDFSIDVCDTLGYEDFVDRHCNRFQHSSLSLLSSLEKYEVVRRDSSIYWIAF